MKAKVEKDIFRKNIFVRSSINFQFILMVNLLPENKKKEIIVEKNRKIILILVVFCLISVVFLFLFLFSFKIYLSSQIRTQNDLLSQEQEKFDSSPHYQYFKESIENTNKELIKIKNFYKEQILIVPILEKLSRFVPSSIYFTRLYTNYPKMISEPESDYSIYLTVKGYARNRKELFLFQKALKENNDFIDVDVSLDSWMEPENVDFHINIKIK